MKTNTPEYLRSEYHPCGLLVCRGTVRVLDGTAAAGSRCTISSPSAPPRLVWVCQLCLCLYRMALVNRPTLTLRVEPLKTQHESKEEGAS